MTGFLIASFIGFFWWAAAVYSLGILYSVKPIRLKARFGADLLVQALTWFVLPFLAPVSRLGWGDPFTLAVYTGTLSLLMMNGIFLYQLADYQADEAAGLASTHVVLGMRNSLIFGAALGILGLALLLLFSFYLTTPWIGVFVPVTGYTLYRYGRLWKMKQLQERCLDMQGYVRLMKPVSQFLVPYVFLWWILG